MREHPHEMEAEEIIARLKNKAGEIFAGRDIAAAYLYGSIAKGYSHPYSDVDIALLAGDELAALSPYERFKFEIEIELAVAEATGIDFSEVRVVNDAPLEFRGQAAQGIRLYCVDQARRVAFETRAWKEYFDYQPVIKMMSRAFWARIRKEGLGGRASQTQRDPA